MKNLLFTLIVLLCAAPCLSADGVDGIRPAPDSVTLLKGSFRMSGAAFKYSSSLDSTAREAVQALASRLSLVCGKTSPVSSPVGLDGAAASGAVKGMIFLIDNGMPDEAYSLDIQPGTAVVRAGGTAGILHSVQTLRQMLPDAIYEPRPVQQRVRWILPCCTLADCPDNAVRAVRIDVAAAYSDVAQLESFLDNMASVKLNVLRLMVADDDCWRPQTEAFPLLAQMTAYRGEKTYTRPELERLVRHARLLGISIVPEIGIPSKMLAELSLDSLPLELSAELEDIFGTAPLVFEGGPDGSIEEFVSGSTASELEGCASRLWGSQGQ